MCSTSIRLLSFLYQDTSAYSVFSAPELHSPDLVLLSSVNGLTSFLCMSYLTALSPALLRLSVGGFPAEGWQGQRSEASMIHFLFAARRPWMVLWVSHSDAKHRKDFLHIEAPRLHYVLNWRNWILNISLKFLYFFPDDFISSFAFSFFVFDDSDLWTLSMPWRTFWYLVELHWILPLE